MKEVKVSIYEPTEIRLSEAQGQESPHVLIRFPGCGVAVAARIDFQETVIETALRENLRNLQGPAELIEAIPDRVNNCTSFYIKTMCTQDAEFLIDVFRVFYRHPLTTTVIA